MKAVFKGGKLVWINGAGYGYKGGSALEFVPIPDQDVSSLFTWDNATESWEFTGSVKDVTFYPSPDDYPKTIKQRVLSLEADVDNLKIEVSNLKKT